MRRALSSWFVAGVSSLVCSKKGLAEASLNNPQRPAADLKRAAGLLWLCAQKLRPVQRALGAVSSPKPVPRLLPVFLLLACALGAEGQVHCESSSGQAEACPPSLEPPALENYFGLQSSAYRYREPQVMSLAGPFVGALAHFGRAIANSPFSWRNENHLAVGSLDYDSPDSGSASMIPAYSLESRALLRWHQGPWLYAAGLGVRYWVQTRYSNEGSTSTGHALYQRESTYVYLPLSLGLSLGAHVFTAEYRHLLSGRQVSRLSDVSPLYPDVSNHQLDGWGAELRYRYHHKPWQLEFEPFIQHWNLAQSDRVLLRLQRSLGQCKVGADCYVYEPANNSWELGLRVLRRF